MNDTQNNVVTAFVAPRTLKEKNALKVEMEKANLIDYLISEGHEIDDESDYINVDGCDIIYVIKKGRKPIEFKLTVDVSIYSDEDDVYNLIETLVKYFKDRTDDFMEAVLTINYVF